MSSLGRLGLASDEALYHPLHAHETGPFHQHGGISAQQRVQRRAQVAELLKVFPPGTERARCRLRQLAECEEMIDAGDQVVSLVAMKGTTRTGGAEISAPGAAVWTVVDGRVRRVEFHLDRNAALRAAGIDPSSRSER